MTGGDVIVLAPWLVFGAGLVIVCARLLRARNPSRPPAPSSTRRPNGPNEPGGSPEAAPRCREQAAGSSQHEARSS